MQGAHLDQALVFDESWCNGNVFDWQRFADDERSWWDAALSRGKVVFQAQLQSPFGLANSFPPHGVADPCQLNLRWHGQS